MSMKKKHIFAGDFGVNASYFDTTHAQRTAMAIDSMVLNIEADFFVLIMSFFACT